MLEYFDDQIKNLLSGTPRPVAPVAPGAPLSPPPTTPTWTVSPGAAPSSAPVNWSTAQGATAFEPAPIARTVGGFGARAATLGRGVLGAAGTAGALSMIPLAAEAFASQSNPAYAPNLPTGFAETPGGAATGVNLPVRTPAAGNVPPPINRGGNVFGGYQGVGAVEGGRPAPLTTPPVDVGGDNYDRMGVQRAPTAYEQAYADASRVATSDSLFRQVDSQVGPGGNNGDAINARIRGFGANPSAVTNFNNAEFSAGNGVQVTRDANGQLTFTGAPNPYPKSYTKADGTATTNYTESEQYAGGVARANKEAAQLAAITSDKENEAALGKIYKNRSAVGRKQAIDLYIAQLGFKGTGAKLAQDAAIAAGKHGIDVQKLVLDSIRTQAEAGEKGASTGLKNFQLGAGMQTLLQGGTAAEASAVSAGRAVSGDRYVFNPTALPRPDGMVETLNNRSGQVQLTVPRIRPPTEGEIQAAMKAAPGKTRAELLAAAKARGYY